jgi:hypothetical protein
VPEAHFNDDVFDREKEYEPDYKDRSGSKKNSTKSETTPKDTGNEKKENPVKESEAGKTAEPDSDGHISTYA